MAKADLGVKRSCRACGMRFYDFNRTPIICPGCSEEFDPETVIVSRKARASKSSETAAANDDAVTEVTEVGDNEAGTNADDMVPDAEAGMDFDDDDVDDEAGGLIQDDISADDELLTNIPSEEEG